MPSEFDADLAAIRKRLDKARAALLPIVTELTDAHLSRARRGGWPVRKVLEHVIHSEYLYTCLAYHLRGLPRPEIEEPQPFADVPEACAQLGAIRGHLLTAIDGIDEEVFYKLETAGHEEYSFISLLENVALHDTEHAPQISEILAAT